MSYRILLVFTLMCFTWRYTTAQLQKSSSWTANFNGSDQKTFMIFPNSMLQGSFVTLTIVCTAGAPGTSISVRWMLEDVGCTTNMVQQEERHLAGDGVADAFSLLPYEQLTSHGNHFQPMTYTSVMPGATTLKRTFQTSRPQTFTCGTKQIINLQDESSADYIRGVSTRDPATLQGNITWDIVTRQETGPIGKMDTRVATVWDDGIYHFLLHVEYAKVGEDNPPFVAQAFVQMRTKHGFLPAITWPLLPARGVLAFLYLCVATVWILIWARSHQHTVKIHMAIGGIAAFGALANTLMFVDYSLLNASGKSISGLDWLGRVVDCGQGSLNQLLLMIVCTGYGITRPVLRKGIWVPPVVLVALTFITNILYFVTLDANLKNRLSHPFLLMAASAVVAILLLVIVGWIMVFSIMTFVHVCRRKHSQKIIVFSIFTGTCLLGFIAMLIGAVLSLYYVGHCLDWKKTWIFACLWDMESLVLLAVLMWLWRPTDESKSYAFRPLNTAEEDVLEESEDDIYDAKSNKISLVLLEKNKDEFA